MAKKKSKTINTAPKETKISKSEETMAAKVEVKKPQDSERVSKIVGTIFIVLGVLLVGFGVYSFVRYNATPKLDTSLVSPSLEEIPSATNSDKVTVKGNASGYDTVYVYVNGEKVGSTKVDSKDDFSYDVSLQDEGSYNITVAGIKGFPTRHLSSQSLAETVVVDRTAPTLSDIKFPTEVGTKTFTVTGTAESGAEIIVKRGTDYYSATCDSKGNFKIVSIALDSGLNVFNVVVKDTAGNETTLNGKISVTYSEDSSVDGDATSTSIPVAAGEESRMNDFFMGNTLVWIFGILALTGFGATTSVLYYKSKRA